MLEQVEQKEHGRTGERNFCPSPGWKECSSRHRAEAGPPEQPASCGPATLRSRRGFVKVGGAGGARPEGAGKAHPEGAGDARLEGAEEARPEGAGDVLHEGAGKVHPEGADKAHPERAREAHPEGAGQAHPEGPGHAYPEGVGQAHLGKAETDIGSAAGSVQEGKEDEEADLECGELNLRRDEREPKQHEQLGAAEATAEVGSSKSTSMPLREDFFISGVSSSSPKRKVKTLLDSRAQTSLIASSIVHELGLPEGPPYSSVISPFFSTTWAPKAGVVTIQLEKPSVGWKSTRDCRSLDMEEYDLILESDWLESV